MFGRLKKLKRRFRKVMSARYDKPLAPPTAREKELLEELRATFRKFPVLKPAGSPPSEKEWLENANRLRELVLNDDPREFLHWDVILRTMSVTYAGYVTPELKYLKSRHDWRNRWSEAIKESLVGHPIPHWRYPISSGNLIHHAYHLAQFEEKTRLSVNDVNFIFEFGGGYGSMCRLLHNLGFQGKYVLFDLPKFSVLQRFFLKSIGAKVYSVDSFKTTQTGIFCISELEELKEILLYNIEPANSMFIATWSISEAPINLRNSILPLISRFQAFLIAYQNQFGEVNNIEFFRSWTTGQKDIEWSDWQIEHIPNNNRYLVGKRKTN